MSLDQQADFSVDVDLSDLVESQPLTIDDELNPFEPASWSSRMRLVGGDYTGRAYHQTPRLVSSPGIPKLRRS